MILAKSFYGERATCRTVYEVKCDRCGNAHDSPGLLPDDSIRNAQHSGWHVPTPFPGEDVFSLRVICPKCRSLTQQGGDR